MSELNKETSNKMASHETNSIFPVDNAYRLQTNQDFLRPITGQDQEQGDRIFQAYPLQNEFNILAPVPDDAPFFTENTVRYLSEKFKCKPCFYPYSNAQGQLMAYVVRWDGVLQPDGTTKKEISPYVYVEDQKNKNRYWKCGGLPEPRPLYNLPAIINSTTTPLLVVEGEKKAEAAKNLLPTWIITTSIGGSNAAHKTDWSFLKERSVIICPDLDEAGQKYADAVYQLATKAGCTSVQKLDIEALVQKTLNQTIEKNRGYDLADAVEDGLTAEMIQRINVDEILKPYIVHADLAVRDDSNDNDTVLNALARVDEFSYQQQRAEAAKELNVNLSALDQEIKKRRKAFEEKNKTTPFVEVEPWDDTVSLDDLLQELIKILNRYLILPTHADITIALWIVFSWLTDSVTVSPILGILSPEKRCGKTTVLTVLSKLVKNVLIASNISPAALYRSMEQWKPTLIIDEADTFVKDNEELRGVINSGHTRASAFVIRTVGDNHTPTQFNTWGAKVLALIGTLPETIADRSIIVKIKRKTSQEKVEKIRDANGTVFDDLKRKLARFSRDRAQEVQAKKFDYPQTIDISDRALDNWEPLLTIADFASADIKKKAYDAMLAFSIEDTENIPLGTELLDDIKSIFDERGIEKVYTTDLIDYLCVVEASRWAIYNFRSQDKNITPRQLCNLLKTYDIHSKNIRDDSGQKKGFEKAQFQEAWQRYRKTTHI